MSEIKKGKLYQKMAEIDKQFNDRMDDLSFKDLEPVLDEAKADLFNTENELTEEWFDVRDAEFRTIIMGKIIKWFGSVPNL